MFIYGVYFYKMEFLKTTIEYLKGVGPQRAETLNKEVRIFTFNDLLHYFDRSTGVSM